jgi:hypothetical protein
LGFRREIGTRDATGKWRIISEQTFKTDKKLCACSTDWQKTFDPVNWTKLMQILKVIGINWSKRIFISKLYNGQIVKPQLYQGETRRVKIGRGVRQGCCLSLIVFNLNSEYLTK